MLQSTGSQRAGRNNNIPSPVPDSQDMLNQCFLNKVDKQMKRKTDEGESGDIRSKGAHSVTLFFSRSLRCYYYLY